MTPKEYCQCDFPLIRNGEYCGNCGKDLETPKKKNNYEFGNCKTYYFITGQKKEYTDIQIHNHFSF